MNSEYRHDRLQAAQTIETLQGQIATLSQGFTQDEPGWYALEVAYQALKLAWWVIRHGHDHGKIAELETAIAALKDELA
jgi:hypothetical protein